MEEKEPKIVTPEGTPITSEDAAKLARDPTDILMTWTSSGSNRRSPWSGATSCRVAGAASRTETFISAPVRT